MYNILPPYPFIVFLRFIRLIDYDFGISTFKDFLDGGAFAAKADEQNRAHVGIVPQADQSLGDPLHIRPELAATLVVEQWPGVLESPGNAPGNFIGAKNCWNNGRVISRSDPAMGSGVA
jgi:hypothetical protein